MVSEVIGHYHDVVTQDVSDSHIAKVLGGDPLDSFSVVEGVL